MRTILPVVLAAALYSPVVGAEMTPREENDELLNAGLPLAQQLLEKYGKFYPFGVAMTTAGKVTMVAGYDGNEAPSNAVVVAMLTDAFLEGAEKNEYKAVAFFTNVAIDLGNGAGATSAIQAGLEHKAGDCVNVFMPYTQKADSAPEYRELVAAPREGSVFGTCSPS